LKSAVFIEPFSADVGAVQIAVGTAVGDESPNVFAVKTEAFTESFDELGFQEVAVTYSPGSEGIAEVVGLSPAQLDLCQLLSPSEKPFREWTLVSRIAEKDRGVALRKLRATLFQIRPRRVVEGAQVRPRTVVGTVIRIAGFDVKASCGL
jgi:hypothetical protein